MKREISLHRELLVYQIISNKPYSKAVDIKSSLKEKHDLNINIKTLETIILRLMDKNQVTKGKSGGYVKTDLSPAGFNWLYKR